jgi:hypothetical protein
MSKPNETSFLLATRQRGAGDQTWCGDEVVEEGRSG